MPGARDQDQGGRPGWAARVGGAGRRCVTALGWGGTADKGVERGVGGAGHTVQVECVVVEEGDDGVGAGRQLEQEHVRRDKHAENLLYRHRELVLEEGREVPVGVGAVLVVHPGGRQVVRPGGDDT